MDFTRKFNPRFFGFFHFSKHIKTRNPITEISLERQYFGHLTCLNDGRLIRPLIVHSSQLQYRRVIFQLFNLAHVPYITYVAKIKISVFSIVETIEKIESLSPRITNESEGMFYVSVD